MDIANQLIETFGKMDSTLNSLDDRMARLSESVDRFAEASEGAAGAAEKEEEVKNNQFKFEKKLAAFQKKRQKDQVAFAGTVTVLAKGYKALDRLNRMRIVGEKKSLKYFKQQNIITSKVIKTFTTLKDVAGLASAKIRAMRDPTGGTGGEKGGGGGGGNRFQKAKKAIMGGKLGALSTIIPGGFLITGATLLVKQLLKVDSTMAGIARETGLVGEQLQTVTTNVQKSTASLYAFGMNMDDVGKNAAALVDKLGNASYVTEELITNTSLIAKATGMSASEAATLTSTLIKGFDKTTPQVKEFADSMMSFASTSGVNARKVMRDISNDSNLTSIYLGRGEDYLMKSAVLAAKMGKSLAEQNQTLDAFSTIESSVENVAEINRLTGANLDAQKMFMMFQTQDTLGVMKELQGAFSNPRAIAMLDKYPGAFKQLAGSLNLSIKDLRQMDRVMADFEKSTMGASKEQQEIEDHIKAGMDILEQMKGIFFSAILPAFNSIGQMLVEQIKPTLNDATDIASDLGKEISSAMDAEETLGGKLIAALTTLITKLEPAFAKVGNILGGSIVQGMVNFMANHPIGTFIMGALAGAKAGMVFGPKGILIGAAAGGVSALIGTQMAASTGNEGQARTQRRNTRNRARVTTNAMGNVYNRPTLGIIGKEGRSEVVIPTERIRKGLPVASSVAAELQSIGVPGYALGAAQASGAVIRQSANTFTQRQQQRAVLSAQGDPEAIRRVEAKIEKQAAAIRKEQRALVNSIMEENLFIEQTRYKQEGGREKREKRRDGFFAGLEKGLHSFAKGLDNFLKVTGQTYTDVYNLLPENFRKSAEETFAKLPKEMQTGLTVGIQEAYDQFLETGKLTEAIKAGAIAGIRAGTAESGGTVGIAGELTAQLLEGKGFRNALAGTLQSQQKDQNSLLNTTLTDLGAKDLEAQESFQQSLIDLADANKKLDAGQEKFYKWNEIAEQDRKKGHDERAKQAERIANSGAIAAHAADEQRKDAIKARNDSIKSQAKTAGAVAGIQGAIRAFEAGEGIEGVAKTGISSGVGAAAGAGLSAGLMASGVPAPVAMMLGEIGGSLVGAGVGKALGFLGLGGKNVKPKKARKKITETIMGSLIGVTQPGMQLSALFAEGSQQHKIIKANIAFAGAKNPEKLYTSVGDALYSASGLRFSNDRVADFIHTLYGAKIKGQARTDRIDAYEREMETGGVMRAGASGAIVSRPTVALIGEAGPEALVPLENAPGARPLDGVGGDGGALLQEIKRMNQMLGAMANRPITLDGQRVNAVLNAVNSDDIRAGIYTVNSR